MSSIRCGIVGLGRIGKIHLENLVRKIDGVEVVAVADVMEEGRAFASKFGVKEIFSEADEVINHDQVEVIFICSPTNTHADYIINSARAGKAIFCEKPLDLSLETVKEVLREVDHAGVPLMVAFNRRFDANFRKVRDMVSSGKVGIPHILKITSRDPAPPPISYIEASGGMFLDMTIHDFDMARFVMGSEVMEVYAKAGVLVDGQIGYAGDVDTAIITLSFENGGFGVIDNSRSATYGYDQRIEVFGSHGMVNIDNNCPDNHRYYGSTEVSQSLPYNFFMDRHVDAYYEELVAFIESLKNGVSMPITGRDGLMALIMGLAAKKSLEESRPVKIEEIF